MDKKKMLWIGDKMENSIKELEEIEEMLKKFKNAVLFYSEVNSIDINFLNNQDLENIESVAYQLQIATSGFDLEKYENNTEMQYFIFETWQKEAQIAMEVAEQVLKNFLEENL